MKGRSGSMALFKGKRRSSSARVDDVEKRDVAVHAGNDGSNFDLSMYYEAEISEVRTAEGQGNVIFLTLKDGNNSILPVYIGEYECGALIKEMHKRSLPRPGTHDLMKNMMDSLGYRITKVRITSLVGNIYHARIHLTNGQLNNDEAYQEIDLDSRPSDAINMAARFQVPIYVNKEVAEKMAHPGAAMHQQGSKEQEQRGGQDPATLDIIQSCKEEILRYNDPTIMQKLQLQVAIAEERFEDASKLRDVIDKMLASDRALSLVVAIETALEDKRFEEAARLRDAFRELRSDQKSRKDVVDTQ
jgi:bifunctional DNase/RNase